MIRYFKLLRGTSNAPSESSRQHSVYQPHSDIYTQPLSVNSSEDIGVHNSLNIVYGELKVHQLIFGANFKLA